MTGYAENYFDVLEIDQQATEREIKQAYAKMLRKYPNETHSEQFQAISKAYRVLSDAVTREKHIKELQNDGIYDRLWNEAINYYNRGKLASAKSSVKELMANGFSDDVDTLILFKNICEDLGDKQEERNAINRLESKHSHLPEVKHVLWEYNYANELGQQALKYAKQLVAIQPHDNEVFLMLINSHYMLGNYPETFGLLKERMSNSEAIIQNYIIYEQALFFGAGKDEHRLVRQAILSLKNLAATNAKQQLLNTMQDSAAEFDANAYIFKFLILLIEDLNANEFGYIREWTDRGRAMFIPNLMYYSLHKTETTANNNPRANESNSRPQSKPVKRKKPKADDYEKRGSIIWAIIFGIIIALANENGFAGIVAGAVWYFFAGFIKSLLSCLVVIVIVIAVLGFIFS